MAAIYHRLIVRDLRAALNYYEFEEGNEARRILGDEK